MDYLSSFVREMSIQGIWPILKIGLLAFLIVSRDALCNLDTDLTEFVSGLCDFLQNMCHG